MPALPQGEPLSLRPLAADTWRTLRAHPLTSTALGAAALLSMASMVFGIGVLVTPWFLCEIFALQLAVLAGITPRRDRAWFRAGFLVLCMVGVVVGATWLAMLIIGPDVATADRAIGPRRLVGVQSTVMPDDEGDPIDPLHFHAEPRANPTHQEGSHLLVPEKRDAARAVRGAGAHLTRVMEQGDPA